ncbi:thiamine phosphate synthase [Marinicrinis sediminis]|uniref:Thiamine-phosphate synthase n=1 Tax=Marinicrinis sediminis TaxID=1652465 RepID=A0ABW5RBZ2_9BACL
MNQFQLYGITDERFHPGRDIVEVMEQAILGGVSIVQLRDKWSAPDELLHKARRLRELTRKHEVLFIVNDHVELALEVDADGVHLGQDDLSLAEARKQMKSKLIGISTHRIEEAIAAQREGADYIGVGPVYATQTKSDVVAPVGLSYVSEVAAEIDIPAVAIGGIKLHNVADVLQAGARRICAVTEIVGSPQVRQTCEAFIHAIRNQAVAPGASGRQG